MASKLPLVLGANGRPQQIQSGDLLSPVTGGTGLQAQGSTDGAVFFWKAGGVNTFSVDANNLSWDYTNHRLNIGNVTPSRPLTFSSTLEEKIALRAVSASAQDYYGFGTATDTLQYQVPAGKNHVFYAGAVEVMRINPNGTITPAAFAAAAIARMWMGG